eukprot:m.5685 g.5685  ORF g.5685 m.5685 type:complete len:50 (+) comp4580_c0_seq1:115-264(+)
MEYVCVVRVIGWMIAKVQAALSTNHAALAAAHPHIFETTQDRGTIAVLR